jgi:organic radical activating enzyme
MFGNNPKRPPERGDGFTLAVQEVFPTVQGEGMFAGYASVFVRLGGCNLACVFCDTEFESFETYTLAEVMARVHACVTTPTPPLVVITGGEPLRQPLRPLTDALLLEGFTVQLETNGTLFQELDARVSWVCSPKAVNGRYHPLRPDVLARVSALKFLISATLEPYMDIPDIGVCTAPVYLQPMDEHDAVTNAANIQRTLELVMQHGHRLSVQLHKMLGIR